MDQKQCQYASVMMLFHHYRQALHCKLCYMKTQPKANDLGDSCKQLFCSLVLKPTSNRRKKAENNQNTEV